MSNIKSYQYTSSNITDYVVNSDCISIGEYAFAYCSNLKALQLPSTIIEFQKSAFQNCSSLKELILPSSLEVIGEKSLSFCFSLELLTIPQRLVAFYLGTPAFLMFWAFLDKGKGNKYVKLIIGLIITILVVGLILYISGSIGVGTEYIEPGKMRPDRFK